MRRQRVTHTGDIQTADIRNRLRQIAERYDRTADSLRPDVRRRIVTMSVASVSDARARKSAPVWALIPRLAAAAAVAVVLALPAFRMTGGVPAGAKSPIHDFEVTARNGQVVLTWQDGNQPRRVVKATSREELAHLSELPGEVVKGEKWVDTRPDKAQLVYYFVE